MKSRIKEIRTSLGLTQQEFSDKIGVKRNTIAQYESGRNEPIDSVLHLICREFDIDEQWLRTGEGEMHTPKTVDEEIAEWIGSIQSLPGGSFKKNFIRQLSNMTEQGWKELEIFCKAVSERD